MLSQLGALGAADATEALTSTINSYKMAAEDAVSIVDRLVAVDNVAATSTRELATALRYVAVVASEAGVTLDELISYIGVISSTTRLNAEQIGQALKTIFTRMQDIKAGKLDEEGVSLNNVEAALKRVGFRNCIGRRIC
jgi:TP901 family phage tail tape measure protein